MMTTTTDIDKQILIKYTRYKIPSTQVQVLITRAASVNSVFFLVQKT